MADKTKLAEQSNRTFRKWAQHYDHDHWTWYFEHCYRVIYALIRSEVQQNSNILDIGCGTGALVSKLSNISQKGKIIGLDPVAEMTEIARKKNQNNQNVNIYNVSFETFKTEEKFDIIFCLNVFHHLENPDRVLTKIQDLLTDNGIFVYLDPFRDNIVRLAWEYVSKYIFFREPYIKYLHKKELFGLFRATGYQVSKVRVILYVILICILRKKNGQAES